MKIALLGLLFSLGVWAKPTVLVSYFDPFGRAKLNNSEAVAKLLMAKSLSTELPFEISLCPLQTKYDVSYEQLKDCIATHKEKPVMVISLGETGCNLKIEMMGRNNDRSTFADNAGIERHNTPIVAGGPKAVGLNFPADEMYCALGESERKSVFISNNAGSFVCNNIAYHTGLKEEDLNYGFIHVPSHLCRDQAKKNEEIVTSLVTMIGRGVDLSLKGRELRRFPVTKEELNQRRAEVAGNKCLSTFYGIARPVEDRPFKSNPMLDAWMN